MRGEHDNTLHSLNKTQKWYFNVNVIKNQTEEAVHKHENKEAKFDYWLTEINLEIQSRTHGFMEISMYC